MKAIKFNSFKVRTTRKIIILLKALALLTICVSTAFAEPKNGFGLSAGWTSNNMSGTTIPGGTAYSYSSSGLDSGLDYQFALSDRLSINPFFMVSSENASSTTPQSVTNIIHSLVGLQLRYWINNVFIGGHVEDYVEDIYASSASTATSVGAGVGKGLLIGWESAKGAYIMASIDAANISNSSSNVSLTGFRISFGRRWK